MSSGEDTGHSLFLCIGARGAHPTDVVDESLAMVATGHVDHVSHSSFHHSPDVRNRPSGESLEGQNLESMQAIEGRVGMHRGQTPAMTGTESLDESQCLGTPYFADHDAIGSKAQCSAQEVVEGDTPTTFDGRWSSLETDGVFMVDGEFLGVFQDEQSFAEGHVEECGDE